MAKHRVLKVADLVETALKDLSDDEKELVRQLAFPPPPRRRRKPGPKPGSKHKSVKTLKKVLKARVGKEPTAAKPRQRALQLED